MNPKRKNQSLLSIVVSIASILASCGPVPTPSITEPSAVPPQPTLSQPTATETESFSLQTGQHYSDTSGDMEVSFLDVVDFQATVNEQAELLEVAFHMRDVPETATRRQIRNVAEYMWELHVFLDPSKITPDSQPDYFVSLMTVETDPPSGQTILTPKPGTPETVPIDQLWDLKLINNQQGDYLGEPDATVDSGSDTVTLRAHLPGISSNAALRFATVYYEGPVVDRPDNVVPAQSANLSTPSPEDSQNPQAAATLPEVDTTKQLIPVGAVRAYPGPQHFAGDVLTFEITNDGDFGDETVDVFMSIDNGEPTQISATSSWIGLFMPLALDTTNLSGRHSLQFKTADGRLNERYALEVLPAVERPINEDGAAWLVHETTCCVLHYISQTAAARDIEFIAGHFQQAAGEFSAITGSGIDPKMNVYIMDRMWGNGGFGGNGELVISYFDRYYGPTVGGEGLETLARHEFTHAADIGLLPIGDGVDFNYEGLAVYVAGGHYKSEPLAERGAALYDLGYYVPVGQFLQQHELAYLYPAAMLTYIAETYGMEKMWQFLATDENPNDGQPGSLEAALNAVFGVSQKDFDQGFQAWLESHEPGEQLDDLRLTVELQDLRRRYQDTYAPPPNFLLTGAVDAVARSEYLPIMMREARAPSNIAVELIIADGQQAIVEGDYARSEALNQVLASVLETGQFEDPLAKDYLEIVLAAAADGYEVVELDLQGDQASTRVSGEPPNLLELKFQKVNGLWQIQP